MTHELNEYRSYINGETVSKEISTLIECDRVIIKRLPSITDTQFFPNKGTLVKWSYAYGNSLDMIVSENKIVHGEDTVTQIISLKYG